MVSTVMRRVRGAGCFQLMAMDSLAAINKSVAKCADLKVFVEGHRV